MGNNGYGGNDGSDFFSEENGLNIREYVPTDNELYFGDERRLMAGLPYVIRLRKRSKLKRIIRLPKVAYKNYRLFRKAGTSIYQSALGSVLLSYWSIKA